MERSSFLTASGAMLQATAEFGRKLRHRYEPLLSRFGERPATGSSERRRNLGPQIGRNTRRITSDLGQHIHQRSREGQLSRQRFVEEHTEAVDVGRRPHVLTGYLFRRHIGRSPHQNAALGQANLRRRLPPRQPEIHDDRLTSAIDHDIGRLQIAMHHAAAMRFLEGAGQFPGHQRYAANGQWTG